MHAANFVHSHARGGPVELWHRRLRHLNVRSVFTLQNMVRGMNLGKISHPTSTLVCKACIEGKQFATKWGNDTERVATKPLEIVHSDVCGFIRNMSVGGAKYFVIFVDDFSRKVRVYMTKCKRKWLDMFKL